MPAGATRRHALLVAPALVSGSVLAACQRSDQSTPATPPQLKGPVELSFFNNWGSGIRKQVVTDAIAEFQRQNPNVTVTPEYFTGVAADFNITTVTRYASGTEWDVGSTEGQFMANLRGSNTLNRLANITSIFLQAAKGQSE